MEAEEKTIYKKRKDAMWCGVPEEKTMRGLKAQRARGGHNRKQQHRSLDDRGC